jgi:deoxyribonuclease-4
MSIAGGMHKALEAALRLGFDTAAVFVKNQRQWRSTPFRADDLDRWFELLQTSGFGPPVAHATYLINLASPDRKLFTRSRNAFAEELHRCQTLHIPYLVVHPGCATGSAPEQAVRRVARALNQIFDRHPRLETMPLLETTAGQGTALGRSFDELGEIIRLLEEPQRVGVCVDTCHVFAAGYDIRRPTGYEAMISSAKRAVGLKRIRCWHFNDSKHACGSRRDRHEHIGRGHIRRAGFRDVLADRRFQGIPIILETPKGTNDEGEDWDAINLGELRALAAQARLRPAITR